MTATETQPATRAPATPPQPFVEHQRFLDCVHCGLCLSACPTYLETGREMDSPRGRIYLLKALQEGRLPLTASVVRHIDLCLGCRACETACPSGVQYGQILEHGRDHIERHHKRSTWQTILRRVFIERVLANPALMKAALVPARLLQALRLDAALSKFRLFQSLALLPRLDESASAPPLPEYIRAEGRMRLRVGLVKGCVASVMFSRTNESTARLLARAGCEVVTPEEQGCCGALFAHGGSLEKARQLARQNIEAFDDAGVDIVITNAAGCGSTLKDYGKLLKDDPQYALRAKSFSENVLDLSEFLHAFGPHPAAPADFTAEKRARVTYHDACHLCHAQGCRVPPRELLRSVPGIECVELPESDLCCGSAGSYNLTEPAMAARLQKRKIENLRRTGADIVVTSNPGCILQIQSGLRQAGVPMRVMHLADFLEEFEQ